MGSMNILIKNLKSSNKNGRGFMHIWQRDITSIDVGLLKKKPMQACTAWAKRYKYRELSAEVRNSGFT